MSDSYLDHIPSQEREKIRRRMRSPEAYERLRERVKGPEDLAREMAGSEQMAELHFLLETDMGAERQLTEQVRRDLQEQGIEALLERSNLSPDVRSALEQGKFRVKVEAHPQSEESVLTILPEGAIQEKLPIKLSFQERYVGQLLGAAAQEPIIRQRLHSLGRRSRKPRGGEGRRGSGK